MPNWCHNSLEISGDEAEIARLTEMVRNGEKLFDFNKIIPMPKELENVRRGGNTINGKYVHQWLHIDGKDIEVDAAQLTELYGAGDWYEWAIQNWGTKWNAGDVVCEGNSTSIRYFFETAWAQPTPVIEELARQFPELRITLKYSEEGMDFRGKQVYASGILLEEEEGPCEEA
jgi:hypothetical protein